MVPHLAKHKHEDITSKPNMKFDATPAQEASPDPMDILPPSPAYQRQEQNSETNYTSVDPKYLQMELLTISRRHSVCNREREKPQGNDRESSENLCKGVRNTGHRPPRVGGSLATGKGGNLTKTMRKARTLSKGARNRVHRKSRNLKKRNGPAFEGHYTANS